MEKWSALGAERLISSGRYAGWAGWKGLTSKVKKYLVKRLDLFLLMITGFLLGRALIVGEIAPFALPFLAVVYYMRRDRFFWSAVSVLGGAATLSLGQPVRILACLVFFLALTKLFERWQKGALSYAPVSVFISALVVNLGADYLYDWSVYPALMSGVEAALSLVLTLIFMQALPLLTQPKRKSTLKNEELVCLIILLASLMTGTAGWVLYGLAIDHIFARYIVLVFAFAAGGAIGTAVGVVTGLILSLARMGTVLEVSLLAFSGLLGGLLKEGKRIGTAFGLAVGTLLMGLYAGGPLTWSFFYETFVAILLFFITPRHLFSQIAQYIPGTVEHEALEQNYMRHLRDVTVNKVRQFADLFQQLAASFAHSPLGEEEKEGHVDLILSRVTEHSCQVCFKKEYCWQNKFDQTYALLEGLVEEIKKEGELSPEGVERLYAHCVKGEKVAALLAEQGEKYHAHLRFKRQCQESRRLVADQLSGLSRVMHNFAWEIQREKESHHLQEEVVLEALEEVGLAIQDVEIHALDEGHVDIQLALPLPYGREECEKIVIPVLTGIVGEPIVVDQEVSQFDRNGTCQVRLVSAKRFKLVTGVATAAKGGGLLSGDSFNTMELGPGKHALAIADGMGNGERAHQESKETLTLLQSILQSGIEETVAIKSINSVLALRSPEEMFSTLDLAIIDLNTAKTKFLKIGSTPSFIKRGEKCLVVSAHNLPIGILQEIEIDVVSEQLKAGDLLIMMSDGLYEAPRHIENKEKWMKRLIMEIETTDPQEVADLLLEKVIRFHQGQILDDMTVVVTKIERYVPEWSTISLANIPKLRKTKRQLAVPI